MTGSNRCATCYGTGELVTDQGPVVCPDCFGETGALGQGARLEWRLRQIEKQHRGSGSDGESDILWLIHELRGAREALLAILARCQDADESDALARDVRFRANEVLGLYAASQKRE